MRTVVAVLPSVEDAKHVAHHLEELGVARKDLNIVPGTESDRHELKRVIKAKRTNFAAVRSGAIRGAIGGLVLGGAILAVPGVGPFLDGSFSETLAASIALGAVAISLMTLCANMARSHEEVPLFNEAIREHGAVLAAHVTADREEATVLVMREHNGRSVKAAEDAWKASGWAGQLENHPYPCDSTVTAH